MTHSELCALDGPALTQLAWNLGLDPRDVVGRRIFSWEQRSWGAAAIDASGSIWRPHERIDQAEEVIRWLRLLGWDTHIQYFSESALGQVGVWKRCEGKLLGQLLHWHATTAEAIALLRCAVLAALCEQEAPDGP